MKKYISILAISILACLSFSCNKKPAQDQAVTPEAKPSIDIPQQLDLNIETKKFVGYWKRENKPMWFEFREDGTYSVGKDKEVKNNNGHWSVDTAQHLLKLQSLKGLKLMRYTITEKQLELSISKKDRVLIFKRTETKPY